MRGSGALCLLSLGVVLLTGCGGGGGSTDSTGSEAAKSTPSTTTTPTQGKSAKEGGKEAKLPNPGPPASAFHPKPHHDSGGGSGQFIQKGGDNSVQDYGQEGSEAELRQAAASLHGFLDARAQGNWAAACGYLSQGAIKGIVEEISKAAHKQDLSCPVVLSALSEGTPKASLRETAIANVGSIRIQGDHAFLIYRGAKGFVFGISIRREDGQWKLETLGGTPIAN